ncbi:MAG: hypothetical protein CMN71_10705 [Sphingomonadaceae bacterium]|nr:hypothetical protein [Sphingomonadaceae bacterium]
MGLTTTEQAVLARSDRGMVNIAIAHELKIRPQYVDTIVSRYAVSLKGDARREADVRAATRALGQAVIAAGGHR